MNITLEQEMEHKQTLRLIRKDLKKAAQDLSPQEVRFLVDTYYQSQKDRIVSANRLRAAQASGEPNYLVRWLVEERKAVESAIKAAMGAYTDLPNVTGAWLKSIIGIGPVLAAGLLAYIDLDKAPHAGHVCSFAGLVPGREWLGRDKAKQIVDAVLGFGEMTDENIDSLMEMVNFDDLDEREQAIERYLGNRDEGQLPGVTDDVEIGSEHLVVLSALTNRRVATIENAATTEDGTITRESLTKALARKPWCTKFKTIAAYLAGESFIKTCNHEDSFYGPIYKQTKAMYIQRNIEGAYAEDAAELLKTRRIGKDTVVYKAWKRGQLAASHIHARARRYAVKLFLSHLHQVMFFVQRGVLPPPPYILTQENHKDFIAPPNHELVPGLTKALKAKFGLILKS